MPQSLVLAVPKHVSVDALHTLFAGSFLQRDVRGEPNLTIQKSSDARFTIMPMQEQEEVRADYETWEDADANFRACLGGLQFFYCVYSSIDFARNVLKEVLQSELVSPEEVWLDNEYGDIFSGKEIYDGLKTSENWSWVPYD